MPQITQVLPALTASHQRLAAAVAGLAEGDGTRQSYASEWTIAQVLSHIGSGAEINTRVIQSVVSGDPTPSRDDLTEIWGRWDAKSPEAQLSDGVASDAALLDDIASLSGEQVSGWRHTLHGEEVDLAGLLMQRLGEHALHTWDVVVAVDPAATVSADAVALLIDALAMVVSKTATLAPGSRIAVTTTEPARTFLLEADSEAASLAVVDPNSSADATASLHLPAEAFLRLTYGRLDPDHTPAGVETDGVDLGTLRQAFPGF